METQPKKFITNDEGILIKVILENGDELDADIVILGIGVTPSTDYIQGDDVKKDTRGYIIVDKCMKTNVDNIMRSVT